MRTKDMNKIKFVLAALALAFLLTSISEAASQLGNLSGIWRRTNVGKEDRATITITNVTEKSFEFSFEGFHGANTGELEGTAAFAAGNNAVCEYKDVDMGVTLEFVISNSELSVSAEGNTFGLFGMGVYIDGEYVHDEKGDPVYTNENIAEEILGVNAGRVMELLGEETFAGLVTVMEEGVASDAEGLTYSGFINGAGVGTDLLIDGDKICCLALNLDENYAGYTFYTNDERYKKELPAVMKENVNNDWALRFIYKEISAKIDDNLYGMFNVILSTVYESGIKNLRVSPYKFNMLGENLAVYMILICAGSGCIPMIE